MLNDRINAIQAKPPLRKFQVHFKHTNSDKRRMRVVIGRSLIHVANMYHLYVYWMDGMAWHVTAVVEQHA